MVLLPRRAPGGGGTVSAGEVEGVVVLDVDLARLSSCSAGGSSRPWYRSPVPSSPRKDEAALRVGDVDVECVLLEVVVGVGQLAQPPRSVATGTPARTRRRRSPPTVVHHERRAEAARDLVGPCCHPLALVGPRARPPRRVRGRAHPRRGRDRRRPRRQGRPAAGAAAQAPRLPAGSPPRHPEV